MKAQIALVHPELQASAKVIPQFNYNPKLLWLIRRMMFLQRGKKSTEDVLIENHFIPTEDKSSKIRLRVYKPRVANPNAPAMFWIHGGGYIIGKPEINESFYLQLVRKLGIVIVAPAYRLAPDHSFPKPLDDCYSALSWLYAEAKILGIDTQRIAIGGESAGGGLAAALIQLLHDRQEFKPVFQMLVYPMLDDKSAVSSVMAQNNYLVWTQASNRFGWESYLGAKCGADDLPAYAVPARRADLSGLPPAWIGVGTLDLFHDEDVLYAQRLQDAGVACEVKRVEGAFHGFDFMAAKAQVVQDFRQSQLNALKKYLGDA
jgi:acetyl esterase/lipase